MKIGTRASPLALAQARTVAALFDDAELVPITTTGDRASGAGVHDKERWVKELELALLAGEIDLALHSAKDVPSELPDGPRARRRAAARRSVRRARRRLVAGRAGGRAPSSAPRARAAPPSCARCATTSS